MSERIGMKEKAIGLALVASLGMIGCSSMSDTEKANQPQAPTTQEPNFEFSTEIEYDGEGYAKITYLGAGSSPKVSFAWCRGTLMIDKSFADDGPEVTPGTDACLDGFLDVGELTLTPLESDTSTPR